MALTKISGDVIQTDTTISVGVITATSVKIGSAVTVHSGGFQVGSSDLHTTGLSLQNINASGVVTARSGIHVTNGNVGIGTENPGLNLKLDIFQTSGGNAVSISNNSALAFRDTAGTARRAAFLSGTNNYYYGDADNVIADSNLFLQANNSVSLFTNGTPYVTLQKNGSFRVGSSGTTISAITSTGLVGIGTTNPQQLLTLNQSTASHRIFAINRANSSTPALYLGNDSSENAVISANNSDIKLGYDYQTTFNETVRITSSGNVGIGTTNPDQNLVVFNPTTTCRIRTKATASNTGVDFQQAADGTGYLWNRDNGSIRLGTNDTERLHILPNGNIALPGRTITRNGSNTVITASGSYLECIGYKDYNASSFNMFDIVGVSNHTSISIEIRHGHEGGGQHGSWMRYVAALNAYTDIMVNYNSTHNYGGGNGFTVTRPQYNTIRIAWNGASSFSESFYMAARIWLGRNQDTPTLSNQSMTNFSSSYNYS